MSFAKPGAQSVRDTEPVRDAVSGAVPDGAAVAERIAYAQRLEQCRAASRPHALPDTNAHCNTCAGRYADNIAAADHHRDRCAAGDCDGYAVGKPFGGPSAVADRDGGRARFLFPEQAEPRAMPAQHGLGLDDEERGLPGRQPAGEHDEEAAIHARQARPFDRTMQYNALLTEQQVFGD